MWLETKHFQFWLNFLLPCHPTEVVYLLIPCHLGIYGGGFPFGVVRRGKSCSSKPCFLPPPQKKHLLNAFGHLQRAVFNCSFICSCSGNLSVCNLEFYGSLGSCSWLIPWETKHDAWAQETEEGKEGGREGGKKGAGEKARAVESVICVTGGAEALCPTSTQN